MGTRVSLKTEVPPKMFGFTVIRFTVLIVANLPEARKVIKMRAHCAEGEGGENLKAVGVVGGEERAEPRGCGARPERRGLSRRLGDHGGFNSR
jgi:hypothetical protein